MKDKLRVFPLALFSAALLALIGAFAPQQLPVVLYKLVLVTLFGFAGYWVDRFIFPYARPHTQNGTLPQLRRAIVVAACVLGGTLGV